MTQSSIHEAKSQLSKLIQRALAGEDVVIAKSGKPVVRLVPIEQKTGQRQLGSWTGVIRMAEDFSETPEGFEAYLPRAVVCPTIRLVDRAKRTLAPPQTRYGTHTATGPVGWKSRVFRVTRVRSC